MPWRPRWFFARPPSCWWSAPTRTCSASWTGAHVLLALVGYDLARFQLAATARCERRRSLLHAARNVAVPSALWIGAAGAVTGTYDASTALLLNNLLGTDSRDLRWQF